MKTGIVTAYSIKGFGFILTGKSQIFFHVCDWGSVQQPAVGMIVSYDVAPAVNRKFQHQAVNIEIVTAERAAEFNAAAKIDLGKAAGIFATGLPAEATREAK